MTVFCSPSRQLKCTADSIAGVAAEVFAARGDGLWDAQYGGVQRGG